MAHPYQKSALLVVHCCTVPEPIHDLDCPESVSSVALDIIDELRLKMLECLLVLQALPDEATLNFDELAGEILTAHRGCQQAYRAASILYQGAELDGRWGNSLSRPKAIFARHNAAVRRGAKQIRPLAALSDQLERRLWQLPSTDRTQDVSGHRPKCSGMVRSTGDPCASSAIYLGAGLFGAHCYSHATPTERDQYRAHHETVNTRQAQSHEDLLELQRSVGERIAADWLSIRDKRQHWVDGIVYAS
ncbi:Uncharacterised protein [Mycobacteroides abscessus subsp. abscessus]|nr:hypothetical protein E3G43_002326 [Mycobacteroides abscessus]SII92282.1 Uncharacterised protein [Mycobacteroides abscessus subsp. abscessus]SIK83049.1 Uncharacterised protein [Mycobacteroides abscessus subsp. abscessus]SIM70359.1 Uncharacterised protein [Mycobacteroides abscessus subsp. abscessus]SLI31610.1 Uncharacterised protein [Mycobacteroides abscessus subsp. abscessus]